jgi:hypothetical protein
VDLKGTRTIPDHGRDKEWMDKELEGLRKLGEKVEGGKISGTVYHVRTACFGLTNDVLIIVIL